MQSGVAEQPLARASDADAWRALLREVIAELANNHRGRVELQGHVSALTDMLEARTRSVVEATMELEEVVSRLGAAGGPRASGDVATAEVSAVLLDALRARDVATLEALEDIAAQVDALSPSDEDGRVVGPLQALDLRLIELQESMDRLEEAYRKELDLDRAHIEGETQVKLEKERTVQAIVGATVGASWFRLVAFVMLLAGLQMLGFAALVDVMVGAPVSRMLIESPHAGGGAGDAGDVGDAGQ